MQKSGPFTIQPGFNKSPNSTNAQKHYSHSTHIQKHGRHCVRSFHVTSEFYIQTTQTNIYIYINISTFKLSYRIYHPIPQFRRFSILYPCLPFPPRGRNGRANHLRGDHQRGQLDAQLGFVVDLQVVTQVVVPGESPV